MWCSALHIALLASFWGYARSIVVHVPVKSINIIAGDNVLLPCSFETDEAMSQLNIQWTFFSSSTRNSITIYYYQGGSTAVDSNYANRVIQPISPNISRNASITIKDVTPADTGTYYCEVHNIPDIQGVTQGHVFLNVLEKPSPPFCSIHGHAESGHLVTLSCHSKSGSPTPTYTWTRVEQGHFWTPRAEMNAQTGVLQIGNLSQFEFGQYQCNASNFLGYSTCSVELTEENRDGAIVGAVIGAVLLAGFIIFIIWFIVHSMNKRKYKMVKAPKSTEMQERPKGGGSEKHTSTSYEEGQSASAQSMEASPSKKIEEEPVV